MGCTTSVSNNTITSITDLQIMQIKNGTISPLSFEIFLKNFYFILRYRNFYSELPIEKHLLILENIGPLTKSECSLFVKNFCKCIENEEKAFEFLKSISLKMICKTRDKTNGNDFYIPVGLDENLWKSIMQKRFKTFYGHFKIKSEMIDWFDLNVINERNAFITEKQDNIPHIVHTKDISLIIQNNPIDLLWRSKNLNLEYKSIEQNVQKPFFWEKSIHTAVYKGKKTSIEYTLSLIPQMFNLPDYEGNNLVHHAVSGNQNEMLFYLNEIGADFNWFNRSGYLPIHLISDKNILCTMKDFGIDINAKSKKDETLLDIKTKSNDREIILLLLEFGVNIFEPDKKGAFWIQKAINKYNYGPNFVSTVQNILIKNKTAIWNENPIYIEIINKKERNDIKDLNEAVKRKDIPRINVLLALGTKADDSNENDETNLFYCAKNNMIEIALILLNNYCNPNNGNKYLQSCLWAATLKNHFEMATLLLKHGAYINWTDINDETLLLFAYRHKKMDAFYFVLKNGADIEHKNKNGNSITFLAFLNKDDEIAELLQDRYKGNINEQDLNKNSLAHIAYNQGDLKRIQYLSRRGIDMNLKNKDDQTILQMAFYSNSNASTLDFLIKNGSNVNVVDKQNNNFLHLLLYSKNPREDIFKVLIKNRIDINALNNKNQFPISIAIEKKHDKLGFDLLNMNCKLLNQKSIHEPIVEALKRGSPKWFEALISHGADAMNEKFGVISEYINSDFYNFNVFQRIRKMNIFIDAPLQMALYKNYNKCALEIWRRAKNQNCTRNLSRVTDCYRRIPLSVAIIKKNGQFVDLLLQNDFCFETADNDYRTPFIYACIADHIPWMVDIYENISLNNANQTDKKGYSGLTYAANNKRKDFCDALFINNIDVNDCKLDQNGIIEHYRNLIKIYNEAFEKIKEKCRNADSKIYDIKWDLEKIEEKKEYLDYKIRTYKDDLSRLETDLKMGKEVYQMEINKLSISKKNIECELEALNHSIYVAREDLKRAQDELREYKNKRDIIERANREDILRNLYEYEKMAGIFTH